MFNRRVRREDRAVARKRTAIVAVLLATVVCGPSAKLHPASADTPVYEAGLQALDQGLPQVAAFKLRAFLRTALSPELRRAAALTLVRALLAASDATTALAALDDGFPLPPTAADAADPALAFWRGQTLAALERWPEALEAYTRVAGMSGVDPTLAAQARFGRGEALLALSANGDTGRRSEATAIFKALCDQPKLGEYARLRYAEIALDSHHLKEASRALGDSAPGQPPEARGPDHVLNKEHAYLVGRLRLAQRQPAAAQQIFAGALPPPAERKVGFTARLFVDDYWGWARACLDEDQPDRAQAALENLLGHEPPGEFLEASFAWLETLCTRAANPDLTEIQRWADDGDQPEREAYARLTLARLEAHAGHAERAEGILAAFGADFPTHPLYTRALLDLAALRLNGGRAKEARAALNRARRVAGTEERWRTGIETLAARIALAENDNLQAAERFAALSARLGTGAAAEGAAFNATLACLRSGDPARYADARAVFDARFPRSALAAEFSLEEGLTHAEALSPPDATERRAATENLRSFLTENPTHPRAAEARIALAELAFLQNPPDLATARSELDAPGLRRVANEPSAPVNPAELDRAAYLAIWLADAPGPAHDPDQAVVLAKKFLEDRPDSPLAPETRMKLGEIYFAQGDNPDAQTQWELLVQKSPDSPLADAALYLAGQAAASSRSAAGVDKAVEHFSQVTQHEGPFRLPARLRLAELMQDKPADALVLYDSVLAATASPSPLSAADLDARCTALAGKGQTLLVLGATDSKRYREAIAAFDQLADGTSGASLRWRRQAFTLKGKALEKSGETDAALAAYDDALNAAPDPATGPEGNAPEWTGVSPAGNNPATDEERVRDAPGPPPPGAFHLAGLGEVRSENAKTQKS